MDNEEILASRKYTTVRHEYLSKVVLFELVTDGTTCFVDMKLWRGIYREMFCLKEWKAKVAAINLSCVLSLCLFCCR